MSSVALDKIVPFGQEFVLDDMPLTLTLKERVAFFLCLIDVSVDCRKYSESRLGCSLGSHIAGLLDGVEDSSAPYPGDLREEHVLYGVPLGAVRRIVGNPDVDAQFLGSFHEAPLELPAPCIVGTATVTKDADALCAWIYMTEMILPLLHKAVTGKLCRVVTHAEGHVASISVDIVDAVRHHLAVGECGIVMVVHLDGFSAVGCPVVTSEQTEEFLLLRVHTENRDALLSTFLPQPLYILELLITQFAVSHRQGLHRFASGVPFCLYNLPDGIEAYLYMVLFIEYRLDLRGSQPEPLRIGILRESCDVKFYYLTEDGYILGMPGERALPASSLFADSALIEVLFEMKLMTASIDGITGYIEDTADKADAMPAVPFCYDCDELSRLSLVSVLEIFHFLVCYYICWIIRDLHNCLEFSYKGTNFSADLRI
mgnify:FL=1